MNISVNTVLLWTCVDPENDPLTYDIYFGTNSDPPLVITGQAENLYQPGVLNNNTVYFWKIKAYDDHGNFIVGPVWSFTTENVPGSYGPVSYGGQTYSTVLIGSQCWMAENLNIGTEISGSLDQEDNGIIEKYCYNNSTYVCGVMGGLYQWDEMMQYGSTPGAQGICPPGWHIPTNDEWIYLEGTVDSQYGVGHPEWDQNSWRGSDAGGNLKQIGTSYWDPPNTGATNSSGFTSLPAGVRDISYLNFSGLNEFTVYLSSTSTGSNRFLYNNHAEIGRQSMYGSSFNGCSARCLKD